LVVLASFEWYLTNTYSVSLISFFKGKGARFQLFGDAVNVTGHIEGTGEKGRIHLSEQTADLLKKAGKGKWLQKRESKTQIKGKGEMQTYWLSRRHVLGNGGDQGTDGDMTESTDHMLGIISQDEKKAERRRRLIDWNVEVLLQILKQIVARRNATKALLRKSSHHSSQPDTSSNVSILDISCHSISSSNDSLWNNENLAIPIGDEWDGSSKKNCMPLEEVKEIIHLPEFDSKVTKRQKDADTIKIPEVVLDQLKTFVTAIAEMYRDNSFHNFAHAR
jgi:hypothetical protein